MKAAVFLERDGILNGVRIERQAQVSPRTVEEFKINEGASEGLKALREVGFVLLATTNQPGLSRGHLSRRELDLMHGLLLKRFPVDQILVCPHDDMDGCPCRKPKSGLLLEAAFRCHLDLDQCFVISDKWQDAAAAHNAGCRSILIESPWVGTGHRDYLVPSLNAAVHKILQLRLSSLGANGSHSARHIASRKAASELYAQ